MDAEQFVRILPMFMLRGALKASEGLMYNGLRFAVILLTAVIMGLTKEICYLFVRNLPGENWL